MASKTAQSLADRLATARRPERSIDVYLRGDLRAEWDDLQARLKGMAESTSLHDPERAALTERIREIETEIADSRLTIRLRGLNRSQVTPLAKVAKDDDAFNVALFRHSIVDPEVTEETAAQLVDVLSAGDVGRLITAAQNLTFGEQRVPFSHAASATAPNS